MTKWLLGRTESIQYNAALAITGALRAPSREELHQETGFENLHQKRLRRQLCLLYKILSTKQQACIHDLLPQGKNLSETELCLALSFLEPITSINRFTRVLSMNGINSISIFVVLAIIASNNTFISKSLLKFIGPAERKTYHINDPDP